jgi:hypothetical protein
MSDKALMKPDDALLDLWAGANKGEDTGEDQGPRIPILKINQKAHKSKHGLGVWVVGMKLDEDDNPVEEGQKVKGLIVLAVRNRFSYYDQGNTRNNCTSPIFASFQDEVRGSNYGYVCTDKTCPQRNKEGNPRCKAQKVVFASAITEANEFVDCVAYLQGANYMPFSTYIKEAKQIRTKGGFVEAPSYGFITLVGSEKKKNGAVIYYEGVFKRGSLLDKAKYEHFSKKHEEALHYIEAINKAMRSAPEETAAPAASAPPTAPPKAAPKKADPDVIDVDAIDISHLGPMTEVPDDIPFDAGSDAAAAPEPDDFDIEAAINTALNS